MKPLALAVSVATLATAFSSPSEAASNCKMDLVHGVLSGLCDFSTMFTRSVVQKFLVGQIRLPDLVPHGMRYSFFRNGANRYEVDASVGVDNVAAVAATAFSADVVLAVSGHSATTGLLQTVTVAPGLTVRSQGLGAGSSQDLLLPQHLTLVDFDPAWDIDIAAMMSVDTPTPTRASGEVIEGDETNNRLVRTCRIYGLEHFDTSVRRCN